MALADEDGDGKVDCREFMRASAKEKELSSSSH